MKELKGLQENITSAVLDPLSAWYLLVGIKSKEKNLVYSKINQLSN